ncbi:hypothetical protein WG926_14300 [Tistrella sp. BH-R2-4]|uniref:Glycosyltransferase RgtA/B/C/D-like domain-containing protein n=1 Tax=Tistrella arctica TaxID=3133430 RepID=A0ABU9YL24_9PROT
MGMAEGGIRFRHLLPAMLLPLLALAALRWIWGFDGLYGQDAHEYARFAGALQDWIAQGVPPGWHAWPVGFTLLGALGGWITGDVVLALQMIAALSLAATVPAVARIIDGLNRPSGVPDDGGLPDDGRLPDDGPGLRGLWLFLAIAVTPALFQAGVLVMSDMTAIAFGCWAIVFQAGFTRRPSTGALMGFAAMAVAAVGTRYGMAVLLLLPGLHVAAMAIRHRAWAGLAGAIMILAAGVALHIAVKQSDAGGLFQHYSLTLWSASNWFVRDVSTADGIQHYPLPTLVYVVTALARPSHLPLVLVLPFLRLRDLSGRQAMLLAAAAGLYALFLAGIPFQNPRFQLPLHPLAAALLYPAWLRAAGWARRHIRQVVLAVPVVMLAVQMIQAGRALSPLIDRNRFERHLAALLQPLGPGLLYTFDVDPALGNRDVPQRMVNLWSRRIDDFEPGALILFAPDAMAAQWAGRNPMLNWQRAERTHVLEPVADAGRGWRLVRVGPPRPDTAGAGG